MLNKKGHIGELLVDQKQITQQQLDIALAEQKKTGQRLGQVLIDLKFIDEISLLQLLSKHLRIPFIIAVS